jgi:3-deoxy-D-manno-octulosonate 8-phosphate phosphatase (KDO 8-P phosphatase)
MMESDKFKDIDLLLMDVDGVLTDGSIIYHETGEETKVFNSKDGLGITLLLRAGIPVGLVTARKSPALRHRCKNLGITLLFEGSYNKVAALEQILEKTGIPPEKTAFIGDDLPDLPMFHRVGMGIAVSDAHEHVLQEADLVTSAKGGAGAVREVCDAILKSKGIWERSIRQFEP